MSSTLLSALNANGILAANASSNIANMNTQGYRSIRTTLVENAQGSVEAVTDTSQEAACMDMDGNPCSNVDLATEYISLMRAKEGFEAALVAIRAREEMMDDLMESLSR